MNNELESNIKEFPLRTLRVLLVTKTTMHDKETAHLKRLSAIFIFESFLLPLFPLALINLKYF